MTPPPHSEAAQGKESYVYVLRSKKDNKYYLGWTTDLRRRLDAHNCGTVSSTKNRAPLEMIHYETYPSKEMAKSRERSLKRNPRMLAFFKKRALISASLLSSKNEVVG